MADPVWVGGAPVPQGSMIGRQLPNGRIVVVPQTPAPLKAWRKAIGMIGGTTLPKLTGPVVVQLHFRLARGRTVTRDLPTVTPDLDKLSRAVLDALTGIAWEDDAQVVELHARKTYSDDGPGVWIRVGRVLTAATTPALIQEGTP